MPDVSPGKWAKLSDEEKQLHKEEILNWYVWRISLL